MAYSNFDIKTPYFCFDIDVLSERMTYLSQLADRYSVGLCYAIKANAFLAPYMLRYTPRLEVCSLGELDICKAYKLPMEAVVLSGVNKEREYVADGISSGVGIITAESELHFKYICEETRRLKPARPVRVLLRLTNGSQFGMDESVLRDIIARRAEFNNIEIVGIHYFTGTQKKKLKTISKELDLLYELLADLKASYGYEAKELEYGPGLFVPYFTGEDHSDLFGIYEPVLQYISDKGFTCKVTLEMGRYFVASCGEYVTSIVDIKTNKGTNCCIIDGGSNHIKYHGQNMAMNTPVIEHVNEHSGEAANYSIYGSLCSFYDILAMDYPMTAPQTGDRLVFKNIGAYSITEGIYLFLSRSLPDVYVREDGQLTLLRSSIESSILNRAEGL